MSSQLWISFNRGVFAFGFAFAFACPMYLSLPLSIFSFPLSLLLYLSSLFFLPSFLPQGHKYILLCVKSQRFYCFTFHTEIYNSLGNDFLDIMGFRSSFIYFFPYRCPIDPESFIEKTVIFTLLLQSHLNHISTNLFLDSILFHRSICYSFANTIFSHSYILISGRIILPILFFFESVFGYFWSFSFPFQINLLFSTLKKLLRF